MISGFPVTKQNQEILPQTKYDTKPQKTLLFSKKLLSFLREAVGILALISIFVFYHPYEAQAGFCFFGIGWCGDGGGFRLLGDDAFAGAPGAVLSPSSPALSRGKNYSDTQLAIVEGSALLVSTSPAGVFRDGVGGGDGIFVYQVQSGDTPSSIAESFGVSVNTILWANDISRPGLIKIGDKLIILPISGVRHEVKKGDTISGIAKKYGGNEADILLYNGLVSGEDLIAGDIIIIPDGELDSPPPSSAPRQAQPSFVAGLPELRGFFMAPIQNARRSRGIHGTNAVDLVNSDASGPSCGRPVFASAAGTVLRVRTSGWNGGYGKYIVISHPNGAQTLYSHLQSVFVSDGAVVAQGKAIGLIGSTGNSTGCHVHFEVRGAKNPF